MKIYTKEEKKEKEERAQRIAIRKEEEQQNKIKLAYKSNGMDKHTHKKKIECQLRKPGTSQRI